MDVRVFNSPARIWLSVLSAVGTVAGAVAFLMQAGPLAPWLIAGGMTVGLFVFALSYREAKREIARLSEVSADNLPEHYHPLPNWHTSAVRGSVGGSVEKADTLKFHLHSHDGDKRSIDEVELTYEGRKGPRTYVKKFDLHRLETGWLVIYPEDFGGAPDPPPDGPYMIRWWELKGAKRVLLAEQSFMLRGGRPEPR